VRDAVPIRFGTSGWRGVLGEEVTFARLRALARAVGRWLREDGAARRVLIGYDGRFASEALARSAADVLRADGLRPVIAAHWTPTPVVTHALQRGRWAAGLVLTASHNPPLDHGLKVFDAAGAGIGDPVARRIEALAARALRDGVPAPDGAVGHRSAPALGEAYLAAVADLLDRDALRRHAPTVVYDAMHGAAAGHLDTLLERLGVRVIALRTAPDPRFGGGVPDPVAAQLGALIARTRAAASPALGLANDGDGDRVGVVDGRGRVLTETQVIALLVDHLARTGRIARGVALGRATGSLVARVAEAHGLTVMRRPIGFKHLSAAILADRADVAGDESGGFAYRPIGPDKDGMLAAALLVELVATTGRPIEQHVARLEAAHGASACGRRALRASGGLDRALVRLAASPPTRIGGVALAGFDAGDGLRFELADGGFLMFRRSGTEPLLRIYAEAADAQRLERRLELGQRLLARSAR